ncbi:hypothetical protein FSP39_020668 [Pinctada imbricata]|uniref:Uncharacterized protein n=1 Tax=Pinctada imbricata TaxID=66713 RepID=A0AA88Y1Q3_PINIB|nr:hypothetical protein FSP39_020668 [Pinctada imbricata]
MEETEVKSTITQEKDEIQKETSTISVTNGIISTQAEGPESQNKEHGNVTRTQIVNPRQLSNVLVPGAVKAEGSTVCSSLVRHIYVVLRRTKAKRIISKLSDIPEDDLLDVLKSVSSELSIAYQYQIAILADDAEVYRAADFAVSCIMTHLRSKQSLFNPTEALQAVTEDTPSQYFPTGEYLRTKILKTDSIKGKRRQQWVLDEIFKQPGIRIPEPDGSGYKYYDCFTPYGYACRPEKYGFRGPLHVWNETEGKYTMIPNDVTILFLPSPTRGRL